MAKSAVRPSEDAYRAADEYSDKVGQLLQLNDTAHKKVLDQYRSIQAARFGQTSYDDSDFRKLDKS